MKKLLFAFITLFAAQATFAQHPSTDPRWSLALDDDFNGSSINTSLWDPGPSFICYYRTQYNPNTSLCEYQDNIERAHVIDNWSSNPNVTVGSSICTLSVTQVTPYYANYCCTDYSVTPNINYTNNLLVNYNSGMLWSHIPYKYGYYEIRFMLPKAVNNGYNNFQPNFWLWGATSSTDNSELDIFENNYIGNSIQYTSSYHYLGYDYNATPFSIDGLATDTWHTIACNWTPDKIEFFINGVQVRTSEEPWVANFSPMHIIVDINAPTLTNPVPMNSPSVSYPFKYYIDYVKIWQLDQYCTITTDETYCNTGPVTTDSDNVYKSITTGNTGCDTPFNDDVSLKATDYIILDENTTIPNNKEVILQVDDCMDY